MTLDGFARIRQGLGKDVRKEGSALTSSGKGDSVQLALGTAEAIAGTGLTVLGIHTGFHALRSGHIAALER